MTQDSPDAHTRAALILCRIQGCRCEVEVEYHPDPDHPGLGRVQCSHDDWCPLLLAQNRHAS